MSQNSHLLDDHNGKEALARVGCLARAGDTATNPSFSQLDSILSLTFFYFAWQKIRSITDNHVVLYVDAALSLIQTFS
jgi:hypothetical protein